MSVEDLLDLVGGFSRYHWYLMVFVFITTFMNGVNYYAQAGLMMVGIAFRNRIVFLFAAPPHECEDSLNMTGFYNYSMLFPTLTSENDWVCDQDYKPNYVEMSFWLGNILGFLLWGYINDKYGRRPTVIITHIIYTLGDTLTFVAPEFYSMLACRFLVGSAHMTVSHLPYMIVLEYCDEKFRIFSLFTVMFSYSLSSVLTPLLAMYLTSWHWLLIMATLPNLIVLIAHFGLKLVPESPAWLLCRGRVKEADGIFRKIANVNGVSIDETRFVALLERAEASAQESHCADDSLTKIGRRLLNNKKFLFRAFLSLAICFIGYTCYYGHVGNTANLGGDNIFMNFVYGAIFEMFVVLPFPLFMNWIGRRWTLAGMLTSAIISSSLFVFLPEDAVGDQQSRIAFAVAARVFAAGAYYVCLQFASEIFPTEIRGKGSSAFEICGGLGLFIQPEINYLSKSHDASYPVMVFGGLSVLAMFFGVLLPETANEELPQTIEEANSFGKGQHFCHCLCCSKDSNKSYAAEISSE